MIINRVQNNDFDLLVYIVFVLRKMKYMIHPKYYRLNYVLIKVAIS